MNKCKVVFLGSRELGYKTLKWLLADNRFDVVGVCLITDYKNRFWDKDPVDLIEEYNLQVLELEQLEDTSCDLGISVNYDKILKSNILKHPKKGFWNIHHSYNLRLKGRNITTHAILRSRIDQIFYHGTTLHKMVEDLDSGPIVDSKATPIYEDDTAYTLFTRVNSLAYDMFVEWIPRIAFENIYTYLPPQEGILSFKAVDLPSKNISLELSDSDLYDLVRAYDFPGQEPAYVVLEGKKIKLVIKQRNEYRKKIEIANRIMYTQI